MATQPGLPSRVPASWRGCALCVWLRLSVSGASEVSQPSLFQPQSSVLSGQGNPQIWCVVLGSPASAHVMSWYRQLMGSGPTFLLSLQEGTSPTYGLGVNPRFLAEMDPAKNAALLTVGNASPADEGTYYYCALWFSGQYVFGEGTRLLYQGDSKSVGIWCPSQTAMEWVAVGRKVQMVEPCLEEALGLLGPERPYQKGEDTTGGGREPMVSWLQLPWEMAGISVTCQGLHQTGVSEVVLPLPCGQGCRRLELKNGNETHEKSGHTCLELEQTLTAVAYCYLGLLGAALIYSLILAALWRNRCHWTHPIKPLTLQGQKAALGSTVQVGKRCPPARAAECKGPSPSGSHVL